MIIVLSAHGKFLLSGKKKLFLSVVYTWLQHFKNLTALFLSVAETVCQVSLQLS